MIRIADDAYVSSNKMTVGLELFVEIEIEVTKDLVKTGDKRIKAVGGKFYSSIALAIIGYLKYKQQEIARISDDEMILSEFMIEMRLIEENILSYVTLEITKTDGREIKPRKVSKEEEK